MAIKNMGREKSSAARLKYLKFSQGRKCPAGQIRKNPKIQILEHDFFWSAIGIHKVNYIKNCVQTNHDVYIYIYYLFIR